LFYGVLLAASLFILKWLELHYVIFNHSYEIYTGILAVVFTLLGIWLALKLARPKTVVIEKQVFTIPKPHFELNTIELARTGLSNRELEVLQSMADGLSNQEIALRLFVSLNTVKTHGSRIFEKLGVRRRVQAIEKARGLNIIP
jgi:NarL family two-component system response regulator LiaR